MYEEFGALYLAVVSHGHVYHDSYVQGARSVLFSKVVLVSRTWHVPTILTGCFRDLKCFGRSVM